MPSGGARPGAGRPKGTKRPVPVFHDLRVLTAAVRARRDRLLSPDEERAALAAAATLQHFISHGRRAETPTE